MEGTVRRTPGRGDPGRFVLLFFLSLFLLTSSGRLNNWDPEAQLQAATLFVTSGRLDAPEHPMPHVPDLWVRAASGRYYQAHDLGGTLFLVPAAAMGVAAARAQGGGESIRDLVRDPPLAGRLLAVLQYAALAAVGAWALYRLFAAIYSARTALLLTLAFVGTTTYWAYARVAYDMIGGCVGVCLLLAAAAEALRRQEDRGASSVPPGAADAVRLGLAFGLACAFRFSLTPFLLLGLLGILAFLTRRGAGWRFGALTLATALLCLVPGIVYNLARTAQPLKTGATGSAPATAALTTPLREGVYGLLVSPNWGLFWFAPVLLLLLALPFAWRRLPVSARVLFASLGVGFVPYVLTVAKLRNWTGFAGWGPRYLLPLLPVLFVGVAALLVALWPRRRRPLVALLAVSAALNLPPVLVNFRLARDGYPGGAEMFARQPRQQMAAWRALRYGVEGRPLPAPPEIARDPIRSLGRTFPDFWFVRLAGDSRHGAAGALGIAALLGAVAAWSGRRALLAASRAGERTGAKDPAGERPPGETAVL